MSDESHSVFDGSLAQDAPVEIRVIHASRLNFAMQQLGLGLLERVSITNLGAKDLEGLVIETSIDNGEAEPWRRPIALLRAGETYNLAPEEFSLKAELLATRTERERTCVRVKALVGDRVDAEWSGETIILPFDQWAGATIQPESLAAFATPNHPAIAQLLGAAREALRVMGVPDSLDGYQSKNREKAAEIAEACYRAALALDVGYIHPPANFEHDGQRVRLADRLLRERLGTCLDLSLLLASMWEQAGLNAVIVLFRDHALPAVWTQEEHFAEAVLDDPARLRNRLELGHLVCVESTLLCRRGTTFAQAAESGAGRLRTSGADGVAIDIRAARSLGVVPLPLRFDVEQNASIDTTPRERTADAPAHRFDRIDLAKRAEGSSGPTSVDGSTSPFDRVARWKSKLLDLSLRNRLINFRETAKVVPLRAPRIDALEDMLADGKSVQIIGKGPSEDDEYLTQELDAGRVRAGITETECDKRLLELYRSSRSIIEETGANALYLAIGTLVWYETDTASTTRRAPLILLPIQIARKSAGGRYQYFMSLSDEPLRPNITLLQKLQVEFGFDVSGLADMPEDDLGIDVQLILRRFRDAIRESKRWEVEESASIGLFSFNKFLMWKDLEENVGELKQSALVRQLVDREPSLGGNDFPEPRSLDASPPSALLCTRDADSSQLVAVRAASDGRTFVLQGPPGTGKSQTIANIIADALAKGKRVLFVAEKMAALSVVRKRLADDGLGFACLELHSAKASKKQVLDQLREALDAAGAQPPEGWDRLCDDLTRRRDALNNYANAMHAIRPSGESIYRVVGRLEALGDGPVTHVPATRVREVSEDQLRAWRRLVGQAASAAEPVVSPSRHPLRELGSVSWSFGLPGQAKEAIDAALRSVRALHDATASLFESIGHAEASSEVRRPVELTALRDVAALMERCPSPPRSLIDPALFGALKEQIEGALADVLRLREIRERLEAKYQPELLGQDLLSLLDRAKRVAAKPPILRWFAARSFNAQLRPYRKGPAGDIAATIADLESARGFAFDSKRLKETHGRVAEALGQRWNGIDTDVKDVRSVVAWLAEYHQATASLRTGSSALIARALDDYALTDVGVRERSLGAVRGFLDAHGAWSSTWSALSSLVCVERDASSSPQASEGLFEGLAATLERWRNGLGDLNDWCAWREARDAAVDGGFGELIARFEGGELKREDLPKVFERSYGRKWLQETSDADECIRTFNANIHDRTVEEFKKLDRELIALTKRLVASKAASRIPRRHGAEVPTSEMGLLTREIAKRSRHLPTRQLLQRLPSVLPRLKPCFLMSPLSVAQYLGSPGPRFDLVVFDEASQIPVWDAIGAVARGGQVIVVGDSKQMPPTSFFDKIENESEEPSEIEVDDMESVLDECDASNVPSVDLRWHYRSRHESLIAFSNFHYYDNRLHTFPSPEDRSERLGVTLRLVEDGVYDRGATRTNRQEAERLVQEVVRILREEPQSGSIGVVTFSSAQQRLIEDLFDAARREHPEIEPSFTSGDEPVFVKNLENVQGDERDTILFSVGYGRDATGRMTMTFGPLNVKGGERRLNVAVTRARKRLIVFSSIRAEDIDLRSSKSEGLRHFRTFLEYAERGPRAIAEAFERATGETESPFEDAVRDALRARGYDVDAQIGCAGYRIDLAVRDPERPGRYLVGVECDGATYHSAATARDRDRLRQSVLEGLGWTIVRVWSTDWLHHKDRCVARVEEAVRWAKLGLAAVESAEPKFAAFTPKASAAPTDHAPVVVAPVAPLPAYRVAPRPEGLRANVDLYETSTAVAARSLAHLVRLESPILKSFAARRMAEWFGGMRMTQKFMERFDEVLRAAMRERTVSVENDVLWRGDEKPRELVEPRVPSEFDEAAKRAIDEIPLPERVGAVKHVLEQHLSLGMPDLEAEASRLLGVSRVTDKARESIREAVVHATNSGIVVRNGSLLSASPRV